MFNIFVISKGELMPIKVNGQTFYRTAEVCNATGMSKNTLFKLSKNGFFNEAEKRDWRGWRLFSESQLTMLRVKTGQNVQ